MFLGYISGMKREINGWAMRSEVWISALEDSSRDYNHVSNIFKYCLEMFLRGVWKFNDYFNSYRLVQCYLEMFVKSELSYVVLKKRFGTLEIVQRNILKCKNSKRYLISNRNAKNCYLFKSFERI